MVSLPASLGICGMSLVMKIERLYIVFLVFTRKDIKSIPVISRAKLIQETIPAGDAAVSVRVEL